MADNIKKYSEFKGFTEQTNDFIIGIKFNNNKEWFHANKEMYDKNVHKPIVALANEIYELMHKMDSNFVERPKISRINRDIRFSKNKQPYKVHKWFFLRADGKPDIQYDRPTFFFELGADWWRYGLFYSPKPARLAQYRKRIEARADEFEAIMKKLERGRFFEISGESYKKDFKTEVNPYLKKFTQLKYLELTRYEDYSNMTVYSPELVKTVFKGYKKLYSLYQFLDWSNNDGSGTV